MVKIETKSNIKLRKAQETDKNSLKNLHQLYLHDLSEYTENLDVNGDGVFENNDIDIFFEKDALIPLIIEYNETIVGFILLNTPPYTKGADYLINDFFILRKYRSQGLGKIATKELFRTYAGKFATMQLLKNQTAISFWKKVFNENGIEYKEKEIIDNNDKCLFQEFQI
jgi:predicted acetyltransferase